jgi:type II secretory pathway component GspD/PulD (secretin)
VKRRIYVWISLLVAIVLSWGGHRAYLASRNLVTLNVRDADVRAVVRKCEWQTWETIVVNKDVKGKVTLNVRKVPLEEVLGIIGEQTSSRATAIYPIFSKGKSIVNLRKLARGDLDRTSAGWTNFVMRGEFGRVGIGIMDGGMRGLMVSQEFRN